MVPSTLFNILWTARFGTPAEKAAALVDAVAHLQSLSNPDAANQLLHRGDYGRGVLHLLAWRFSACEQTASLLSLVIERGRESCGTTALVSLRTIYGSTPLHHFVNFCSNLSLTKMVLREHPPSLAVLDNGGKTPLHRAEPIYGSTSERVIFFLAATTAFNASNFAALEALCGGSSPYLARMQAIALRAAVAISLNRQEEAPSALDSVEASVTLSLLERVRDFGRVGDSSDLLRVVLSFLGPCASQVDAE